MRRGALLVVIVAACGGKDYDPQRFVDVCAKAKGYDGAAAYDPTAPAGAAVPVAFVDKTVEVPTWYLNEYSIAKPFVVGGVVAPTAGNRGQVQLAVCIEQQAGAFAQDCVMGGMNANITVGGGAPDVDVTSTGRSVVVKAYSSRYVVTVRQARTARVLVEKTVDVPFRMCPIMTLSDPGGEQRDYARIMERQLVDIAGVFLPEPTRAKVLAAPTNDLF